MIGGLCLALLALAMAPLWLVQAPAMLDYPDHLARLAILSSPPSLAYAARWRVYPNLAMDLAVPALARLTDVASAAKIFLGLAQALFVGGAVFLEWVVKRRCRLGGLGALLVLFSTPFAWGEVNFEMGLALALWALALWIRLRDQPRPLRWLVHALAVMVLFTAHFAALGVYGLALGLIELSQFATWPSFKRLLGLTLFLASPLALILGLVAVFGGQVGQAAFTWTVGRKVSTLVMILNPYAPMLGLILLAAMGAILGFLAVSRTIRVSRQGAWLAGGLFLAWLLLPQRAFGAWDADARMITAAAAILPAFVSVSPSEPALAAIIAIIVVNILASPWRWLAYAADYRQLEASFHRLEPGAAVLVGRADPISADDLPFLQAPALAAPAADVFVSNLFTVPGEQPIAPKPRFAALDMARGPERAPPPIPVLIAIAKGAPAQPNLAAWPRRYRYLYVVGRPAANPLPGVLQPLVRGRRFTLYEIGGPRSSVKQMP